MTETTSYSQLRNTSLNTIVQLLVDIQGEFQRDVEEGADIPRVIYQRIDRLMPRIDRTLNAIENARLINPSYNKGETSVLRILFKQASERGFCLSHVECGDREITPKDIEDAIDLVLSSDPGAFLWFRRGSRAYFVRLQCADAFIGDYTVDVRDTENPEPGSWVEMIHDVINWMQSIQGEVAWVLANVTMGPRVAGVRKKSKVDLEEEA